MLPRLVSLLLALIAAMGLAAPASAEEVPPGYEYTDAWFKAQDGVQLHAGVFLPKDRKPGEKHPTIMVIGPYTAPNNGLTGATAGGPNTEGPVIRFPELFTDAKILKDRWAYVQVDARGFGGSGGCFEYYGPNEMKDAGTAVDWAASQPWSTGKVATWGKSYDAADSLLAVAARPKGLAAAVIQAPGLSAYTALWHNRVHYATGRYGTTPLYTADDYTPPQNADTIDSPDYMLAAVNALTVSPTCRTDSVVGMNTEKNRDSAFWKDREPYKLAAGATTPVIWTHGFYDANTKPEFLDVWPQLRGPKRGWFGQFTHLRAHEAGVGRKGFLQEAMRFLDEYVRGVGSSAPDPPVTVQEGNGAGRWRAEAQWPPADAREWKLPLRAGTYKDTGGNAGDGPSAGKGHFSITPPLRNAAHLAGEPVLNVQVTTSVPDAVVVAHLYDIDDKGQARLVNRGAMAAPKTGTNELRFRLYPQDWVFQPGHRIGVSLSGSDDDWWTPGLSNTDVKVDKGDLTLPLLRYVREESIAGGKSESIDDARPFAVPAAQLRDGIVNALPPAQERRPLDGLKPFASMPLGRPGASGGPGGSPRRAATRSRATLRLKLRRVRGRRVLVASGRAPGAKRVALTLRLGDVRLSKRTAKVRRGAYRITFPVHRLRSGRLVVQARLNGRGRALRAAIRLR